MGFGLVQTVHPIVQGHFQSLVVPFVSVELLRLVPAKLSVKRSMGWMMHVLFPTWLQQEHRAQRALGLESSQKTLTAG